MPALFLVVVDPYAVPQVSSSSLKKAIGFKTEVSYCDALMVLKYWITQRMTLNGSSCHLPLYLHHYSVLGQVRLFLEGFWLQKTSIGMTQQDALK